jgi:hypothetical protein
MSMRKTWAKAAASVIGGGLWVWVLAAADPPAVKSPLVIIDSAGKEQKVKGWTASQGTRRLSWLTPAATPKEEPVKDKDDTPKDKGGKPIAKTRPRPSVGPEALEFREENSTTFVEGILTLVPLERIRAIEYDDKDGVSVKVALDPKADGDLELKGTTKYRGINKLTLEAEVDKGELGVAQLKFLGGVPKGIRAVRFESPKPGGTASGRVAAVTVADKAQKAPHTVFDLQPLYQGADGNELLLPMLHFKKTLKVDVGKVQKVVAHDSRDPDAVEWTVLLKDGTELTLSLLRTITHDGRTMHLEGMVGKAAAGYKLFPLHTFTEIQFDEVKGDKPKEP